jgi:hypothetical protein
MPATTTRLRCALLVGVFMVIYLLRSNTNTSTAKTLTSKATQPPRPYSYAGTMNWLRQANLTSALRGHVAWVPPVDEFDLDAARMSKWGPWLGGEDGAAAIHAAKGVNKWLFMDDVIRDGRLASTATPGMHLYILRRLRPAVRRGSRRPTFIDAGCGTGYLLPAWVLMAGDGARAIGLELDASTAGSAREHVEHPDAVADSYERPARTSMSVHVSDALAPDGRALGVGPGEVHAINVGLAVETVAALDGLTALLAIGGLLAVPLCEAQQPAAMPADKCAARFRILSKLSDGSLSVEPHDPGVPVRFIRGMPPAPRVLQRHAPAASPATPRRRKIKRQNSEV